MKDDDKPLLPVLAVEESAVARETPTAVPALNEAEELAAAIVNALDKLAEHIPDLRSPDPRTARKVRGGRTVSREAVASTITMVESSPKLQALSKYDGEKARRVLQARGALRMVSERLAMFLARINYTIEAQWAEVAHDTTRAYSIASALTSPVGDDGDLAQHVKVVGKHLGRTNRKKGKKEKSDGEHPDE